MTERELYEYNKDTREDFEKILYDNSGKVLPASKKTLNQLVEDNGGSYGELFDIAKNYKIGNIVSNSSLDIFTAKTDNIGKEPSLNEADWDKMNLSTLETGEVGINATAVVYARLSNTSAPSTVTNNIASVSRIDRNTIELFFHPDAKITNSDYLVYSINYNSTAGSEAYISVFDKTEAGFKINISVSKTDPTMYSSNYVRSYLVIIK